MLRDLLGNLDRIANQIRRGHAIRVNDQTTKDAVIELAQSYFSTYRPRLVESLGENEAILSQDLQWQDALRQIGRASCRERV